MTGNQADDEPGVAVGAVLPRLTGDEEERLTGAELRRLTARVRAHNVPPRAGRVAIDVGEASILLGLVVLYTWGFGAPVRELLVSDPARFGLGPGLVQALMLALAVVAGAVLALRLGPAGLSAAGVRWWLPTPADRAGFAAPSVVRSVLVGVGAGLVAGGLPAAVVGVDLTGILLDAALGGALGLVVVAGAGVLQVAGAAPGARWGYAFALLVAAVPVAGLGLALWAPPWESWAPPWPVPAVLGVLGCAALVVWTTGLERLRAADLRLSASTTTQTSAAVLSLDTTGLSRALGTGPRAPRGFSRVLAAVRGPATAILAADALLLLRSPGALAGLVAFAAAGAVAVQVPVLGEGIGLWVVLAGAGYAGALAGAPGPRAAGENARLDSLVPLGARVVRAVRVGWPALAAGMVLLLLATVGGGPWIALAVPTAVVLGAAAVRAAYREPVRWDMPMIATPAGALPTGLILHWLKGPDMVVLGTLPLVWVAVAGVVSLPMIAAQVVCAAGAVLWAVRVERDG